MLWGSHCQMTTCPLPITLRQESNPGECERNSGGNLGDQRARACGPGAERRCASCPLALCPALRPPDATPRSGSLEFGAGFALTPDFKQMSPLFFIQTSIKQICKCLRHILLHAFLSVYFFLRGSFTGNRGAVPPSSCLLASLSPSSAESDAREPFSRTLSSPSHPRLRLVITSCGPNSCSADVRSRRELVMRCTLGSWLTLVTANPISPPLFSFPHPGLHHLSGRRWVLMAPHTTQGSVLCIRIEHRHLLEDRPGSPAESVIALLSLRWAEGTHVSIERAIHGWGLHVGMRLI